MCVLFAALFQLEPSSFAFRTLFPPKERHNVGLLRFDDDHDHICYRFAQVRIFGGKSNVFKSLQCLQSRHYAMYGVINKVTLKNYSLFLKPKPSNNV
jgi:hypothetical protein